MRRPSFRDAGPDRLFASLVTVLLTCAICAARGHATQNPNAPPPDQNQAAGTAPLSTVRPASQSGAPPPAIRATTRLVQVSVVVHDKRGEPIRDLTQNDFVLLDEKKPQEIRIFSVETNAVPVQPPPALPPDTFTNRIQRRGNVPTSITVILFDGLNTQITDQAYAKQQVVKFIEKQVHPQDRVAIYSLGRDLRILHDFTNDASSLLAALASYRGRETPLPNASVAQISDNPNPNIAAFLNNAYQREANFFTESRVHQTIEALIAIANHVGTLPGRKNLIWVSATFPFTVGYDNLEARGFDNKELFADDIETAARALTNANVSVYPVDARGLIAPDTGATRQIGSPFGNARTAQERAFRAPSTANFDTMNMLADRTGGRAFYNRNDIWGAIRDAIDDSRVTYEIGYYPQGIEWNGKFREIKVEVKRPGAHVRARKGYFALPEPKLTPQLRQAIIALSAKSPLEPTGIGITTAVQKLPGAEKKLRTITRFDLHDFAMQMQDGHWNGIVDSVILQLDNQGQIINASDKTFRLHLEPALYEKYLKEGVTNTEEVAVLPNTIELRIMMRDGVTGTIGGLNLPLAKYFPNSFGGVN